MVKRTVEIDDDLDEIIESAQYDLKEMTESYLDDNPDMEEAPDLYNDLDYDGSYHELIDGSVVRSMTCGIYMEIDLSSPLMMQE